jgi:hypothetical protein
MIQVDDAAFFTGVKVILTLPRQNAVEAWSMRPWESVPVLAFRRERGFPGSHGPWERVAPED